MTSAERHALTEVTDYLEALLNDAIENGLPQVIAADIRLSINAAREALRNSAH